MGGGAWPFLVGGLICQANSDNERDLLLLNRYVYLRIYKYLLRGTLYTKCREAGGNNRSVMPLDVLGCTRATLIDSTSSWVERLGNSFENQSWWGLMFVIIIMNEEFLVNASHQLALITSLPFVHTARRTYRLNGPMNTLDFDIVILCGIILLKEVV